MTRYTPTLGVWLSQADFCSGKGPILEAPVAKGDLVNVARLKHPDTRNFLLARKRKGVGRDDYWEPVSFFGMTGAPRKISPKQIKVYSDKRGRVVKDRSLEGEIVESTDTPIPAAQEQVSDASVGPEGPIVLTLSQNVAEVLRDTFTLVAQGRTVEVRAVPEANTEQ